MTTTVKFKKLKENDKPSMSSRQSKTPANSYFKVEEDEQQRRSGQHPMNALTIYNNMSYKDTYI